MRPLSPTPRFLIKAGSVVLLWLLSISVSYAAHAAVGGDGRRICDPVDTKLTRLRHHVKSLGGPLAKLPRRDAIRGPLDLTARLLRTPRTALGDGDQAIPNDSPAAPTVSDPIAELQPLGLLVHTIEFHARTRLVSPRSPRGPPTPA